MCVGQKFMCVSKIYRPWEQNGLGTPLPAMHMNVGGRGQIKAQNRFSNLVGQPR